MLTNSSWTNARRQFRLWRRSRPFWGGLLLIVAGIELFASANLDLTAIQFHLGPEGFLSYLLPVLLLVCGVLVWLTPQQRAFYAIIATLTAIYSLIGLNLGGFLLGTLIGMVGGGLAFAWTPTSQPGAAEPASPPEQGEYVEQSEDGSDADDDRTDPAVRGRHQHGGEDEDNPYGPSGAVTGRRLDEPGVAPAPPARHRSNLAVSVGVPILVAAALMAAVTTAPSRALAAPTQCPTKPAAPAAGQAGAAPAAAAPPAAPAQAAAAPAVAAPTAASAPAPTPTPTPTDGGPAMTQTPSRSDILLAIAQNIRNAWIEFWAKVFGIPLSPTPTPTPTATPIAPAATPTTTAPATQPTPPPPAPTTSATTTAPTSGGPAPTTAAGTPSGGNCSTPTASPGAVGPTATPSPTAPPKIAPAAAGQPTVAETPAKLTASTQVLTGFSFDGVTTLPTASGSIRALQFSATRATSVDFALQSAAGGRHSLSINSNPLVVSGTVTLFATRFQGTLLGIPLTFTPDVPPPITLPDMTFTNVTIDLAFLNTTSLQAPTLAQTST